MAAAPSGSAPSTFSALRHTNYRLFWMAQGLSVIGITMEFVALGWLVYSLTRVPFQGIFHPICTAGNH